MAPFRRASALAWTRHIQSSSIAFDAMDCDTALAFAAEGTMPVLAGLLARMARCPLLSPPGLFLSARSGPISPPAFAPTAIAFIAGTRWMSRHTAAG